MTIKEIMESEYYKQLYEDILGEELSNIYEFATCPTEPEIAKRFEAFIFTTLNIFISNLVEDINNSN